MSHRFSSRFLTVALALVVAASALVPTFAAAAITSNNNPVNMVMTNPTEDCLNSVNLIWHSPVAQCQLIYTTADDTGFANAETVNISGASGTVDYYEMKAGSYYRYVYTLEGLTEDTQYIYKITNSMGSSAVYTFKTASSHQFRFISLGDTHVNGGSKFQYVGYTETLLNNIEARIGSYDLTIFSGDYVQTGATYNNWVNWNNSKLTTSSVMALTVGNHDTDNRDNNNTKKVSDKWFNYSLNNPKNGPTGLESVYWFNYNGVMFICLNTLAEELSEFTSAQKNITNQVNWMRDVVKNHEGEFQYLVVFQHQPLLLGEASGTFASWSYYGDFYRMCDTLGVDFFIGGDNHEYARTVRLYNNAEVSAEGDKGTYYITNPMITSYNMSSVSKGTGKCAAYYPGAGTGAAVYSVSPKSILFQLVNADGKVIDQVEVPNRRTVILESNVLGDLDGNGRLNDDDAIYLLFHSFFPEKYPLSQDADYNNDENVDDDDAIYLLFHIFFPEDYPLN